MTSSMDANMQALAPIPRDGRRRTLTHAPSQSKGMRDIRVAG